MKSVLISIQPNWLELICKFLGWDNRRPLYKKRLELRKSKPNSELPFKAFIYCTKRTRKHDLHTYINSGYGRKEFGVVGHWRSGEDVLFVNSHLPAYQYDAYLAEGKVVGEFICDYIIGGCEMRNADIAEEMSCVSREDILKYSNGKEVFGWHISDLVIYDKPKELSEFYTSDNSAIQSCKHREIVGQPEYKTAHNGWIKGSYICNKGEPDWCTKCKTKPLKRPPQSWCYVEEVQK